jgi:parallel beta-helix repeat protein
VPGATPKFFSANGIYLDNSASNWLIEYNQVSDVDAGIKMNFWSANNKVLHNSLGGTVGSIIGNDGSASWAGTIISGNTLYNPIAMANPGATISGNTSVTQSAKPTGTGASAANPPPTNNGGTTSSTGQNSSTSRSSANTAPAPVPAPAPAPLPAKPAVTDAFAPIAAGSASGSLGTLPDPDGSVIGLPGNWLRYSSIDFGAGATLIEAELAAIAQAGEKVEFRIDTVNGPLITTLRPTTSSQHKNPRVQLVHMKKVSGVHDVYLLFVGHKGEINLQSFQFAAPAKKHGIKSSHRAS